MKVSAGRIDRKVTLHRVTYTTSGDGSRVRALGASLGTLSAGRETQAALEHFAAAQTIADVDTLWRTRWNDDLFNSVSLSPKDFILKYRDREYEILGLIEIGRKEGLHIATKSRGDTGGTP